MRDLAARSNQEQDLNEDELGEVEIFIGDDHYTRALAREDWFLEEVEWWRRPLWALDILSAAGGGWAEQGPSEVRGKSAITYAGAVEPGLLKQVDPDWRKLVGRRAKREL